MHHEEHFILFRLILYRSVLISEPKQFFLPVFPVDIHAQINQPVVDNLMHGIRLQLIRSTFNGNRSLIIRITRSILGTILALSP